MKLIHIDKLVDGVIVVTPTVLNYALFAAGMAVVWFTTHSLWALLGAWLASVHLIFRVVPPSAPTEEATPND